MASDMICRRMITRFVINQEICGWNWISWDFFRFFISIHFHADKKVNVVDYSYTICDATEVQMANNGLAHRTSQMLG